MGNVFTIFCHGTDWNRDKKDPEIVNFFGRNTQGVEYESWLMLDGVGSRNKKGQMAGQFDWASKDRLKKRGKKFSDWLTSNETVAQVTGAGLEDNVRHAIVAVANLDPMPTTINLIGWSRGAITTLVFANRFSEIFPDISINIFAVDPVAGMEAGIDPNKPENRTIPAAVKNYLAFLAIGENRSTFKPQDVSRVVAKSPASNVTFLPIYGHHTNIAIHDQKRAKEVTQIVWSTAYLFLKHFGTPVQKAPDPFPGAFVRSDSGLLNTYSLMKLNEDVFKKIKQKGMLQFIIGNGFESRDFLKNLDDYVVNPEYFINQHHRKCFKASLPETFKYLFTAKAKEASRDKIEKELKQATAISTLESLQVLGVELANNKLKLPEAGFYDPGPRSAKLKHHCSLNAMGILEAVDDKTD